jgi:hypothetical protein
VERLPVRYAAIVCVAVGAMFMAGAGAPAFAAPGADGGDGSTSGGGTQNTDSGLKLGGLHLPGLSGTFTVGPIAPPAMNLPQLLGSSNSSPNVANLMLPGPGTPGLVMLPLAPLTVGAPDSAGRPVPAFQISDETSPQSDGAPKQSPTTSVLPSVPPWVPVGQPVTIDNPLPDTLPTNLQNPIVPQLLPPPLVVILMAAAQRIPFAGLLITPVLTAKVPAFLAALLTPAPLSDIVLPAGTVPTAAPDAFSEPAGGSLPTELGVTGMDVSQAPDLTPPVVEPPHWTSPVGGDVTALSDPVAFRAGYSDYLRNAGMAQVTAIAVPGAAAILLFTLGGGFIGYRQARAGHVIRAEGITRFLR